MFSSHNFVSPFWGGGYGGNKSAEMCRLFTFIFTIYYYIFAIFTICFPSVRVLASIKFDNFFKPTIRNKNYKKNN